ncbi:MAG: Zn-ribbon domain-containing OB-fold protein [Gammaproteobacteria bacterium]|jgi:uncharacterized OB-fold protein
MSTTYDALPEKPRPQIAPANEPYWQGLREHRLLVQRCSSCGKLRHYPRPMCDACYAMDYDWHEIDRSGTVYSWAVTHHPFHPGFKREVPYVIVTTDLGDGIRIQAPLAGNDASRLALGAAVVVEFVDVDAALTLPALRLAGD